MLTFSESRGITCFSQHKAIAIWGIYIGRLGDLLMLIWIVRSFQLEAPFVTRYKLSCYVKRHR